MADAWDVVSTAPADPWAVVSVTPTGKKAQPKSAGYNKVRAKADATQALEGDFTSQMVRNLGVGDELAGGVEAAIQGVKNTGRRLTGQPVEASVADAYQAGADASDAAREKYKQAHPTLSKLATAAGFVVGGAPAKAAAPLNALQMARQTAIATAPFAVAQQKGNLVERLPGAALNTGLAALTGGVFTAGGNALAGRLAARTPVVKPVVEMVDAFDKAHVRPTYAAMSEGAARMAKAVGENALVGGRVRAGLKASIDDTANAAERVAGAYGSPASRGATGEAVQEGVQGFNARFSKRASKMYDDAFASIDQAQDKAVGAAKNAAALMTGRGGARLAADAVIAPTATVDVLRGMAGRVHSSDLAKVVTDQRVPAILKSLESDPSKLRFGDLRALRTWVREAQSNPELRQGIDAAGLQRLEGALTSDIYTSAERLAGPVAARRLRQADTFYKIGSQRIQGALQQFVGKAGDKAGEGAYDLVLRMASDKGGADIGRLTALKKSLQPNEWNDVAATVVSRLGKPAAGVADQGPFSVSGFVTNFEKLSSHGKDLLFGSGPIRAELDNLAKVAGMQKGVERAANHSNSAANAQGVVSAVALANPLTMKAAAGGLAGMAITGEAMTNPAFVRWLADGAAAAAQKTPMAVRLARLGAIAARDPSVLPAYESARQASTASLPVGRSAKK